MKKRMNEAPANPEKRIALFQRREIRRTIHNNEWWFVVIDVVAALSDSVNPKGYLTDMRRRDPHLAEALKGGGKLPPPLGLEFETGGGMLIGGPHVRPSSVERLIRTVGELTSGMSGSDETSHVLWAAS